MYSVLSCFVYELICHLLLQLTLKHRRKLAKNLAGMPAPYSLKVKVFHKSEVFSSLENAALDYQLLTFEDEEGRKLKTVLYGDTLAAFEDVMEEQMDYEISNARVRVIPGLDWEYPNDQVSELHFTVNTQVQPIATKTTAAIPHYTLLGSIPRFSSFSERYDILGILIYVDTKCKITKTNGEVQNACELLIIDQSSEQIMIVTASQDQAIEEYQNLQSIAATFPVLGFTALRISYQKGFSLKITHKTSISLNPTGKEACALRAWSQANKELLTAKCCHVSEVRRPATERIITTFKWLLQKKVKDTLHEERYWLQVQLNTDGPVNFSLYLGCSNCNTRSNEDIGVAYKCYSCFKRNVISCPRMNLTFKATDDTGSYFFTALTENTEILLKASPGDLYSMLLQERQDYLDEAKKRLSSAPVYIQVAPAPCLSIDIDRVTIWFLEQISLN